MKKHDVLMMPLILLRRLEKHQEQFGYTKKEKILLEQLIVPKKRG